MLAECVVGSAQAEQALRPYPPAVELFEDGQRLGQQADGLAVSSQRLVCVAEHAEGSRLTPPVGVLGGSIECLLADGDRLVWLARREIGAGERVQRQVIAERIGESTGEVNRVAAVRQSCFGMAEIGEGSSE